MIKLEQLEENREELFEKALKMAKMGNEKLLKLFLERLLPAKPKDNPIGKSIKLEGSFAERSRQILDGIVNGELTPEEGRHLSRALNTCGIAPRLDKLNQNLKQLKDIEAVDEKY